MPVRWVAFPLHPETPLEGQTLEALFAGRGVDIPAMLAHLKATARGLGLSFGDRRMTYNSRRAQELGKWAEALGRAEAFHRGVFRAYFAQGQNIARRQVLKHVAEAAGLPADVGLNLLQQGRYRQAVDDDWQRARAAGVTAVPTFAFHGRTLVGAQPYDAIRDFLLQGRTAI